MKNQGGHQQSGGGSSASPRHQSTFPEVWQYRVAFLSIIVHVSTYSLCSDHRIYGPFAFGHRQTAGRSAPVGCHFAVAAGSLSPLPAWQVKWQGFPRRCFQKKKSMIVFAMERLFGIVLSLFFQSDNLKISPLMKCKHRETYINIDQQTTVVGEFCNTSLLFWNCVA